MLPRTSMLQLYARRVPAVAQWGVGLGFIIGWPHLVIGISNRNNKVPPINQVYYEYSQPLSRNTSLKHLMHSKIQQAFKANLAADQYSYNPRKLPPYALTSNDSLEI
ncbi:hypothetical protein ACNR90_004248 [Candidozyma auris]